MKRMESMEEHKGSYRKCQSCGYEQTPADVAEEVETRKREKWGFVPLVTTCPKCGSGEFQLHNISWV